MKKTIDIKSITTIIVHLKRYCTWGIHFNLNPDVHFPPKINISSISKGRKIDANGPIVFLLDVGLKYRKW